MADISGVIAPVIVGAVVNGIAKFNESGGMGSVQIIFANAALFTTLAAIGQFWSWDIAQMLAFLYLLATMLTTGAPVIEWFSKLVTGNGK